MEVSTCFLRAFMVWSEVARRRSGFDLLRGGDHSLACRWLSSGKRVSACLSRWSFLTFSPLGVSRLDLVLCSLEDLVCRCRRVVSSYWLYGGFGLSFVYVVL